MGRYVVTGANRGLGLEFTRQLLARGERVIAGCRKPAQAHALNHLAGQHPGHLHVLPLDVASERSIAEFAREAALVADRVDVLINNAGVLVGGERFGELAAKTMLDSFAVNAVAPVLLTQAFAPLLRAAAAGAKVANISSQMGSMADATSARSPSYSMSKAALNMATRRLAAELTGQGIAVFCFHPGWVQTDMGGSQATTPVEESASALLQQIDRFGSAQAGGFFDRHGKPFPW
jgi:NAD(P)-dependent dehydrogenase (short-subunit alcohol dehydrogenase family)